MENLIKKIYKLIASLMPPIDKLEHFFCGFVFLLAGFLIYFICPYKIMLILPAVVAGGSKELLDKAGFGDASWGDFFWTISSSVIIALIITIIT